MIPVSKMEDRNFVTRNKKSIRNIRKKLWPYIFIVPFFIIYTLFNLYPVIYSFFLSLTDWDGIDKFSFIGFSNYIQLFTRDKVFLQSIVNTLIFAINLPVQIIIGYILANIICSKYIKDSNVYKTAMFLPYITVPVAIGAIFSILFSWKGGSVNEILMFFGITKDYIYWLGYPTNARIVTIIMIIWRNFGFTTLLILTAIIQVSPEYYDAAEVDGASFVKKMIHITLPIIRPILLFILITGTSWTFQLYDDISMLFPGSIGGPRHSTLTIVWYIYDAAFGRTTRYGYASALCYGMFVIIAICTFLSFKVGKSEGL